jgi:hypothetical protein
VYPHLGNHLSRAYWNEDPELAEKTADGVEARRPFRDPRASKSMQCGERLVSRRLHRNWPDVFVAVGLENALHVRAIGLVPADVGPHQVRRQQDDTMSELLDPARLELRRAARFHHDRGCGLDGQERQELRALKPLRPPNFAGAIGDAQLENVLCHVNSDRGIVQHDGLLLLL